MSGCGQNQTTQVVRFVMPGCGEVFSQGACTATGEPCRNTRATCKDPCNYRCVPVDRWYTSCGMNTSLPFNSLPIVESVNLTPPEPEFGKAFSKRGNGTLVLCDIPHNDRAYDPYWEQREVSEQCDANQPGTHLGRWLAAQKYFDGHRVEIYCGGLDESINDMRREIYYVESMTPGVGRNGGRMTFKLQDPLMLLSNLSCPDTTPKLAATLATNFPAREPFTLGTSLTADFPDEGSTAPGPYDQVGQPLMSLNYVYNGGQDDFFAATEYICVDKEIMRVEARRNLVAPSGWNFYLVERAVCGTELADHSAGSQITAAISWADVHIAKAVRDMLENCGDIEALAEACCDESLCLIDPTEFSKFQCDNPYHVICGPAVFCNTSDSLEKLLSEASASFGFLLYFDNASGRVRMVTDVPPDPDAVIQTIYKNEVVGTPSLSLKVKPATSITFKHTPADWSASNAASNMTDETKIQTIDSLREPCDRQKQRVIRDVPVITRFINRCNQFVAQVTGERRLRQLECGVYGGTIELPRCVSRKFQALEYVKLHMDFNQGVTGVPTDNLYRILSIGKGDDGCETITVESTSHQANVVACFNCDTDTPTVLIEDPDGDCAMPEDCVSVY